MIEIKVLSKGYEINILYLFKYNIKRRMKHAILKIFYKLLRKFKSDKYIKIIDGPIKGFLWSINVEDSRYILGNYEPQLASIVKTESLKGNRFIDIGANAGYFSIIASKYNSANSKNLAIEPIPRNLFFLKKHFEINNINDIEILSLAVSDKNGEIEFSNSDNLSANTYKKESSMFKSNNIIVKTNSLDQIASDYNLNEKCFIKIDVEGAEFDVLKGGQEYLQKHKPTLMLATHDCHVKGVEKDCLEILNAIGYVCVPIVDEKFVSGQQDYLCQKG